MSRPVVRIDGKLIAGVESFSLEVESDVVPRLVGSHVEYVPGLMTWTVEIETSRLPSPLKHLGRVHVALRSGDTITSGRAFCREVTRFEDVLYRFALAGASPLETVHRPVRRA